MTTTGDLFINIKGNNQGLKRSLQQSSRDIKNFSGQAERTMKNGLGLGDIAAIAGASNIGKIFGAVQTLNNARRLNNSMPPGTPLATMRMQRRTGTMIDQNVAMAAELGNIAAYRSAMRDRATHRARRRQTIAGIKEHRDGISKANAILDPKRYLMLAAPAIAAVAGTLLIANANKWQKRVNNATNMYSSAVIKNQAKIDLKNLRKDIALSRDPAMQASTMMRQRAADYRRNSGNNWAQIANLVGSGWDYAVGYAGQVMSGGNVPRIGQMTTEQRLAKVQGGAI